LAATLVALEERVQALQAPLERPGSAPEARRRIAFSNAAEVQEDRPEGMPPGLSVESTIG
jgi:hypothetical protein